ncbi:MAG: hypothetical protein HQK76_01165 [Desulfobacterales bacterium]|nr:hypothetical protein [Desulfobacterales bacterium]
MPFIRMEGVVGKIYVPEKQECHQKKHNCKDCFYCQMCGDDRCHMCRADKIKEKDNSE